MTSFYRTQGGNQLSGKIFIQGSKNAVLPLMAATILVHGVTKLKHVPKLSDVEAMKDILICLGAQVWEEEASGSLCIDTEQLEPDRLCCDLTGRLRCSVVVLGALLGRFGEAYLGWPGGCAIGERPIDLHLEGLRRMGAILEANACGIEARAARLQGCRYELRFPSVGATENMILAAVCAEGTTELGNCACEPEVAELCHFLNACGAVIDGVGTPKLRIQGVCRGRLNGRCWRVSGDRIAAATYLTAGAITGGEVTVEGLDPWQLSGVVPFWMRMGCRVTNGNNRVTVTGTKSLRCVDYLRTEVFPGFPTDMQSIAMVALAKAQGTSVLEETIFENRLQVTEELEKCGIDLKKWNNRVMINGKEHLYGAHMIAGDLRSGAALLLCGLIAEGESRIEGVSYIERGYECPERVFQRLGGQIALIRQEEQ